MTQSIIIGQGTNREVKLTACKGGQVRLTFQPGFSDYEWPLLEVLQGSHPYLKKWVDIQRLPGVTIPAKPGATPVRVQRFIESYLSDPIPEPVSSTGMACNRRCQRKAMTRNPLTNLVMWVIPDED